MQSTTTGYRWGILKEHFAYTMRSSGQPMNKTAVYLLDMPGTDSPARRDGRLAWDKRETRTKSLIQGANDSRRPRAPTAWIERGTGDRALLYVITKITKSKKPNAHDLYNLADEKEENFFPILLKKSFLAHSSISLKVNLVPKISRYLEKRELWAAYMISKHELAPKVIVVTGWPALPPKTFLNYTMRQSP